MTPAQLGILIALLATTLLGAAGALVYRFTKRADQLQQNAPSIAPTQTPVQTGSPTNEIPQPINDREIPDEWKTFQGTTTYGDSFSIQYPPTWALKGKTLYPSGRIPSDVNSTDPVILLGAGGHGDAIGPGTKTFPAGTARYSFDEYGWFASFEQTGYANPYIFEASYGTPSRYTREEYENLVVLILSTFKYTISDQEKLLIDSWLQQNNLNQYGDPKDTMYAGGTPLFDERTGERTDRYEYIIKKYPKKPWNH